MKDYTFIENYVDDFGVEVRNFFTANSNRLFYLFTVNLQQAIRAQTFLQKSSLWANAGD